MALRRPEIQQKVEEGVGRFAIASAKLLMPLLLCAAVFRLLMFLKPIVLSPPCARVCRACSYENA